MSDTSLNKIIQYGTTAARIAYTPNPAVGSQVLYIWFDTDNAPDTYIWDGSAWVQINPVTGTGDVVGPAVAIDNRVAIFDGTTGKLIKDGGKTIAATETSAAATGAAAAVAALSPLDYLTHSDESASLPNSRELLPGTGVTFDDTVANERTVNVTVGGSGDVVGPASSVDDRIATFDGATGKLIQDGGQTIAQVIAANGGSGDVVGPSGAVNDRLATFDGTTGKLIQDGGSTIADIIAAASGSGISTAQRTHSFGISIGNGIDVITTGVKGYIRVPVAITLISWTILSLDGLTGSIVIDVWADTYANFPPTNVDTICNTFKPAVSSAMKAEDSNIADWFESISAGLVLGFNVDSVTTFKKILFQLDYTID